MAMWNNAPPLPSDVSHAHLHITNDTIFMTLSHKALNSFLAISSLAFAFFWLPAHDLFDGACNLLIILSVIAILMPSNTDLRKNPVVLLGILFVAFLAFSIVWHRITLPESFHTGRVRKLLSVFYFVPIAYAIIRSSLLTRWRLLSAAFAGLAVYLILNFNAEEWKHAWQGQRVDFGIYNAQHTGIIFATCALVFSVFASRFFHWAKERPGPVAMVCLLAWSISLLFSFWGVFITQTRAVWLALSCTLLALPFLIGWSYTLRKHAQIPLRKPLLGIFAFAAIFTVFSYSFDVPELVEKRLAQEKTSWESLRLAASHETVNLTSIGIRVASWSAASEWIMERPLMGWGGRGPKELIRQSDYFSDSFKEQFGHLHNSYIEVLVKTGILGALFIIALIFFLGRESIKSYKQGSTPTDVFIFSWLFFIFWLIVNIFESYIFYSSGIYLVALVAALFYSFCLPQKQASQSSRS